MTTLWEGSGPTFLDDSLLGLVLKMWKWGKSTFYVDILWTLVLKSVAMGEGIKFLQYGVTSFIDDPSYPLP